MRLLFISLLTFCTAAAFAQSPQAVNAYIDRYKAIAVEEMKAYGIPASVTLAQGIHESGCGCSALAINSNNHFGIKCHEEWSGQTYHHDDDAPQECFRVYNCPEESFRDHSEFLKNRPRYAGLFSLDAADYKGWARGLKAAGYATNPKYPEIIINLVEAYNLSQFDKPFTKKEIAKIEAKNNSEVEMIKQSLIQSTSQLPAAPVVAAPAAVPQEKKKVPAYQKNIDMARAAATEKLINGVRCIVYKNDAPIAFIAQKYNLTVQQLYTFNDLDPVDIFKVNDIIYLESKKPDCATNQYEVQPGETMRDVSEKFAVQLSALTKRNEIPAGCEPIPGELIVLRGKREVPLKFKVTDRVAPVRYAAEPAPPPDTKVHTVGASETLYSISRQYNIPLDTLKKINNLSDEGSIKIGQTLIVYL